MKTLIRKLLAAAILGLLVYSANAQITIKGVVTATTPVQITIKNHDSGNAYTVVPDKIKEKEGIEIKYSLDPLEKNYDHTITFNDGTVQKVILIHGAVPEMIWPRQKLKVNVDLTTATADETLVIYWNAISETYDYRPLAELDEINKEAYKPLILD